MPGTASSINRVGGLDIPDDIRHRVGAHAISA